MSSSEVWRAGIHPGLRGDRTDALPAMASRSNPPVAVTQQPHTERHPADNSERPSPPPMSGVTNFAREVDDGVGSAQSSAVARQNPHFREQLLQTQAEALTHPGVLQRCAVETPGPEISRHPSRQAGAHRAFGVVEHPSAFRFSFMMPSHFPTPGFQVETAAFLLREERCPGSAVIRRPPPADSPRRRGTGRLRASAA